MPMQGRPNCTSKPFVTRSGRFIPGKDPVPIVHDAELASGPASGRYGYMQEISSKQKLLVSRRYFDLYHLTALS